MKKEEVEKALIGRRFPLARVQSIRILIVKKTPLLRNVYNDRQDRERRQEKKKLSQEDITALL